MSALTFETLSAELTQALSERAATPPKTTVRCTLGRDKVMVLVEYPLDSSQAEPFAHQTLDWLEEHVRSRFDTTGLPDEVADLSERAEEVSVQLYLKHLSESKPFTMRSFTWKVADGFDDLFGDDSADYQTTHEPDPGFFSVLSVPNASPNTSVMLPDGEEERVLLELEEDSLPLDLESDLDDDLDADTDDALSSNIDTDLGVVFGLDPQDTLSATDDFDSAIGSAADLESEFGLDLSTNTGLSFGSESSDLGSALELESAVGFVPDLSVNSGDALDADLSEGVDFAEVSTYAATDFALPGEAPTLDSSDLDLPTVELPIAKPTVSPSSDFFSLTDELDPLDADAVPTDETLLEPIALLDDAVELYEDEPSEDNVIASFTDELALKQIAAAQRAEELLAAEEVVAKRDAEAAMDKEEANEEATTEDNAPLLLGDIGVEPSLEQLEVEAPTADALTETVNPLAADDWVPDDLDGFSLNASQLAAKDLADSGATETADTLLPSYSDEREQAFELSMPDDLSDDSLEDTLDNLADRLELADDSASPDADVDGTLLMVDSEVMVDSAEAKWVVESDIGSVEDEQPDLYTDADLHTDPDLSDPDLYTDAEDDYEDSNSAEYEYEEAAQDDEAYEEDSAYYLEDKTAESDGEYAEEDYEEVAPVDETEVQRQRELWQQQTKSGSNPLVIVGAVGFVFAGIVGFLLTRPCTLGGCDRIETARIKGEEAIGNLRTESSLDAVTASKKELQESIMLLEPIPVWSSYHDDAQAILPEYERQLVALDLVTEAQGKAYSAALDSQNPPHPASKWQDIASKWREATSALSKVPVESPVRDLAERKLVEYRSNLSTILVRIETESGAETSLRQAQTAAGLATQKMPKAESSEDWEAVLSDWEAAVESLRQIPRGTKAYAEAQSILPEYEKTLQEVRSRAEQERSASRLLLRAQQLAINAQQAEVGKQWTTAVEQWNMAVIQLRDIPDGTFARATSQPLLTNYTKALSTAENNMEVSLRFQPVEPSFYLVCGVSGAQKCSYSMEAGKVRLDVAQGYDRVIEESITPPPERGGVEADAQLVNQSNQLLQQITLLSTQAQIPVELYDSDGAFLARYQPNLDGFVRQ